MFFNRKSPSDNRLPGKRRSSESLAAWPLQCPDGEHRLPIVYSRRKASIALKIRDSQVILEVPSHLEKQALSTLLKARSKWLEQHYLSVCESLSKREESLWHRHGDFELFGRRQGFSVLEDGRQTNKKVLSAVQNTQGDWELSCHPQLSDAARSVAVKSWLEQRMRRELQERLQLKLPLYAQRLGVDFGKVEIKGYKGRWGSCRANGDLQFNWRLAQAPDWVVDYVMVHELCHRVHANHSANFWKLVEAHFPRTSQAKQLLKQHGHRWINFLQ
ncbi:SprT family zinc-dependent metalloprotease [Thiomicrorhabdus sp.]|uniref:M48 family metallopeptidase n=1 Tax=Thiomicrorhabdus sp. TaxID=2039724 RepID=UPI0029C6295F|nr:SprT family zinc-dependent metalloprotease [Thiomicrorhabdus sp.]